MSHLLQQLEGRERRAECLRNPPPAGRDRTGDRVGKLVVLGRSGKTNTGRQLWLCLCDCGTQVEIRGHNLRLGKGGATSCGCRRKGVKPPNYRHGMGNPYSGKRTGTYNTWKAVIARCLNPNSPGYHRYGGRGITVCERWRDFANFLADMGVRPEGKTLDRYPDNDGNYEPGNCRWATPAQQNSNRSDNRILVFGGESACAKEWAAKTGIEYGTLMGRLKRGWPVERALTEPPKQTRARQAAFFAECEAEARQIVRTA